MITHFGQQMKLGRIPVFDNTSKLYGVKHLLRSTQEQRSNVWNCPIVLNQGDLSACVGFSWNHFLASHPAPSTGVSYDTGVTTYRTAQTLDELPGENYEGTSVLAGVKAVQKLYPRAVGSYHWAFSIEDLILAIGYVGPAVVGTNWYSDMFETDKSGVMSIGGANVGGHAYLVTGVDIYNKHFQIHNSWGERWGVKGKGYISFEDMEWLLSEDGEACIGTSKQVVEI